MTQVKQKGPEVTLTPPVESGNGLKTQEMVINMGPQHPSTHGVLRMELTLNGEIVTRAIPHIGYPPPLL